MACAAADGATAVIVRRAAGDQPVVRAVCWWRRVVCGRDRADRDEGGADGVSAGDGRQPLGVGAELAGEDGHLLLAQLRVLASRRGRPGSGAGTTAGRRRPGAARRRSRNRSAPGAGSRPRGDIGCRGQFGPIGGDDGLGAAAGEVFDGGRADGFRQVVQRLDGEFVVGVRQPRASGIGQQVGAGRPAAAALAAAPAASRAVTAPSSMSWSRCRRTAAGGDAQLLRQVGRGQRAVGQQQVDHRGPGAAPRCAPDARTGDPRSHGRAARARRERQCFHNTSVTFFRRRLQRSRPVTVAPDTQVRLTSHTATTPSGRQCDETRAAVASLQTAAVTTDSVRGADQPRRGARRHGAVTPQPVARRRAVERARARQLSRLRRWGTVGALLLMLGSGSSYGAATPIPNPVDGLRVLGLLSRIGPRRTGLLLRRHRADRDVLGADRPAGRPGPGPAAVPQPAQPHPGDVGGAVAGHAAAVLPGRLLLPGHRLDDGATASTPTTPARTTPSATPTRSPTRWTCRWQHTAEPVRARSTC